MVAMNNINNNQKKHLIIIDLDILFTDKLKEKHSEKMARLKKEHDKDYE